MGFIERLLPPWAAAIAAAAATIYAQVQGYISGSPIAIDLITAASKLISSEDLAVYLPAPLVAVVAYLIRRTRAPEQIPPAPSVNYAMSQWGDEAHRPSAPSRRPSQTVVTSVEKPTPRQRRAISIQELDDAIDVARMPSAPTGRPSRKDQPATGINHALSRIRELEEMHTHTTIQIDRFKGQSETRQALMQQLDNRQTDMEIQLFTQRNQIDAILQQLTPTEPTIDTAGDLADAPDVHVPINERQNNPLNIEATQANRPRWEGELESVNRYALFSEPVYGLRAALYLLALVYYERDKLVDVAGIIEKWAPRGDNTEESVDNYIAFVSEQLKMHPTTDLKLNIAFTLLMRLTRAMARFEGGRDLPELYSVELIAEAVTLLPTKRVHPDLVAGAQRALKRSTT